MKEIILNNKEELLKWIKDNIQKIEPSAYISKLKSIGNCGVEIVGGSKLGGVSSRISYPAILEKYPCRFTMRERITPVIDCVENTWLLCMVINETIRRRNFFR